MARESLASKRERAAAIEERMFEHYGPGKASLDYRTPFELTVAVVLSAQCTDAAVNKVTPRLFAAFPTPAAMAAASSDEVAEIIHSLGFFRSKAKNLVALAQMVGDFGGEVPRTMDELQTPARRGPQDRQLRACAKASRHRGGHRRGHPRVPRGAPAEAGRAFSRHAVRRRRSILLKVYPREQWGPINHQWVHVRPRGVPRPQAALRGLLRRAICAPPEGFGGRAASPSIADNRRLTPVGGDLGRPSPQTWPLLEELPKSILQGLDNYKHKP